MLYNPRWAVRQSGLIIPHYSLAHWDAKSWPNFTPKELSCPHCGEYYDHPAFITRLQWVRTKIDAPISINSAHRCVRHNLAVGGAPLSQHKKLVTDISLRGHNRLELAAICKAAGFLGFGYYQTFLHVDLGRRRFWYGGKLAKEAWTNAT